MEFTYFTITYNPHELVLYFILHITVSIKVPRMTIEERFSVKKLFAERDKEKPTRSNDLRSFNNNKMCL